MSYKEAKEVLERAQREIVGEIVRCGQSGGVGRAQNYAPILVNLNNAIKVIDELDTPVDHMANMRAAKASKSQ